MDRRTFIKGLIRCVPAIIVPKLIFDLAPKLTGINPAWETATYGPYSFRDRLYVTDLTPKIERGFHHWYAPRFDVVEGQLIQVKPWLFSGEPNPEYTTADCELVVEGGHELIIGREV